MSAFTVIAVRFHALVLPHDLIVKNSRTIRFSDPLRGIVTDAQGGQARL